jgi:hypothetical protein
MDTLTLLSYLYVSIFPGIVFIIGIFRWGKIDEAYKPLIMIMGCGLFNELFRFFQRINYAFELDWPIGYSLIGYNIYVLIISILYAVLFKRLGVFNKHKPLFVTLLIVFILFWVADHFILREHTIFGPTKFFRIFYSFILCLLAIQKINMLLVGERKSLLKNSSFLICIAVLFFFLPYVLTECVTFFLESYSNDYIQAVFKFRKISLPFIYFIYTLAIIWIPPKKPFIQLS